MRLDSVELDEALEAVRILHDIWLAVPEPRSMATQIVLDPSYWVRINRLFLEEEDEFD